jgi:hypothetical protein
MNSNVAYVLALFTNLWSVETVKAYSANYASQPTPIAQNAIKKLISETQTSY